MFNAIPEYLDRFYDCLESCMDYMASRCSLDDLWEIIDSYYADEEISDRQYEILRNIIKEIQ